MKCAIGLGSNQGDRRLNLETAAQKLRALQPGSEFWASPVIETPALTPVGAPEEWKTSFLNAVIVMEWNGSASDLFRTLKQFERQMGRLTAERWAPRVIDLDLLLFGDRLEQCYSIDVDGSELVIPHLEMLKRGFVLHPLKHLLPLMQPPKSKHNILRCSQELKDPAPLWMGILNLTPDSFSDGNQLSNFANLTQTIGRFEEAGVHILDIGGESTRPGAEGVDPNAEWSRINPALQYLRQRWSDKIFRPLISVDTRHPETAERALEAGADIVNDVSGLTKPILLEHLRRRNSCQYILMHSLGVPADRNVVLPELLDPVFAIKDWARKKITELVESGISAERIIFDPGIGFGKTAQQSLAILQRVDELQELPVRILVGHSRKSFFNQWGDRPPAERDPESIGVSLALAAKGVDILRVHEPDLHIRAHHAYKEMMHVRQ